MRPQTVFRMDVCVCMLSLEVPKPTRSKKGTKTHVERARVELKRRFGDAGGIIARASGYARLLPSFTEAEVEEALHLLSGEENLTAERLSDGTLAYHFRRR